MEFTISRRVRRRGAGFLASALAGCAGLTAWAVLWGTRGVVGPVAAGAAILLCFWRGVRELRRAGRPFRLRVDAFGLTLHDAELSWEQIDAVALRYTSAGDDESAPPKPRLTVWTAPGVRLPRRPDTAPGALDLLAGWDVLGSIGALRDARRTGPADGPGGTSADASGGTAADAPAGTPGHGLPGAPADRVPGTPEDAPAGTPEDRPPGAPLTAAPGPGGAREGRRRYTLLDAGDLDQSLGELTAALAAHAGARFETAPRSVRTPTPVTVAGPERRVPGGERVFRASGRVYEVLAVLCGVVLLGALVPVAFALTGRLTLVRLAVIAPGLLVAGLAGACCVVSLRSFRRPRELRVGPEGIAARDFGDPLVSFAWPEVAALTVGPGPGTPDRGPWLLVWPLPGTALPPGPGLRLAEGHLAVPLIALPAIPGGAEDALPHVIAFAGERFSG